MDVMADQEGMCGLWLGKPPMLEFYKVLHGFTSYYTASPVDVRGCIYSGMT